MTQPAPMQAMRIRVAGGLEVAVPSRVNLMTPYVLLEQEDWFEDEIGFVRRCMAPGMRALDIGANYGLYTLALARAVGPTGRVWAVEPASTTAAFLSESVTLNGLQQVTVLQLALSDRDGLARLRLDDNAELNSLTAGEGHGEEVRLTTLENLAAATGCSALDFIKLDAEGEEERIVSGGSAFLSRENPLVMFEIKHGDKLNLGLVQALGTLGYSTYRLVPGLGVLVPWDPQAGTDAFQLNLFACKRPRADALHRAGLLSLPGEPFALPDVPAVQLHAMAHDRAHAPALRVAALRGASARFEAECATNESIYALSSCARVAAELGWRQRAVELLSQALSRPEPYPAPSAPFLPASSHFDAVAAAVDTTGWVRAALLDRYVELASFSTYFAPPTMLQNLEVLKSLGHMRPAMERRRQLMRMMQGLQAGPAPDAAFAPGLGGTLNPGIWGA